MKNRSLPVCSIIAGWWARNKDSKPRLDRPFKLLVIVGTVIATSVIVERLFMADDLKWLRDWVRGSAIFGDLLFPDAGTVEWKDRLQGVLVLLGLPVAFCLWHWRDKNVRDQIDNSRKDINLKEFQEVQMRAAGALDEMLPVHARQTLQIAALHQLRGFLRGEYGDSFRRPAFELLLAGHAAAMDTIGVSAIRDYAGKGVDPLNIRENIADALAKIRTRYDPVMRERIGIIRDEGRAIFRSGFSLSGRCFDGIQVPILPAGLQMDQCSFIGANLSWIVIENAELKGAHLEGAELFLSDFIDTDFSAAHLEGATMVAANLKGARLTRAHLEGANLEGVELEGAFMTGVHLECSLLMGANLKGAGLGEAHLEGADLSWAHLQCADLRVQTHSKPEGEHGRECYA